MKLGEIIFSNHPILRGVFSFDGGEQTHHTAAVVKPDAMVIASNRNNILLTNQNIEYSLASRALVVEKLPKIGRGKLVCLNFYPISTRVATRYFVNGRDTGKMIANALFYTTKYCKQYQFPTSEQVAHE
jgi:hypothetical protein